METPKSLNAAATEDSEFPQQNIRLEIFYYFANPYKKPLKPHRSDKKEMPIDFFEYGTSLKMETPKILNTAAIEDSEFP